MPKDSDEFFDKAFDAFMGVTPADKELKNYALPKTATEQDGKQLSALTRAFAQAVSDAKLPPQFDPRDHLTATEGMFLGDVQAALTSAGASGESMDSKENIFLTAVFYDVLVRIIERAHPGVLQSALPAEVTKPEAADILKKFGLPSQEKLVRNALKP